MGMKTMELMRNMTDKETYWEVRIVILFECVVSCGKCIKLPTKFCLINNN